MDEDVEDESCDVCGGEHTTETCPELGLDDSTKNATQLSRARLTLPHNLDVIGDVANGTLQVVATYDVPAKTQFGPFEAKRSTNEVPLDGVFALKVLSKDQGGVLLDSSDENECNWMCLVQAATTPENQNCIAYQIGVNIYYSTTRLVRTGEILQVWYAPNYAKKIGKPVQPDDVTKVMLGTDIGKLLSTPRKPEPAVPEPIGKRVRKVNAHVQEFLASARKKIKLEPVENEEYIPVNVATPPKRGRGRPRKVRPPETVTPQSENDVEVVEEIDETEVEGGDFKCTRCSKAFGTQADMVKHLRLHIRSIKPDCDPIKTLFCTECGKGFVNSSNLARHMKIHENESKSLSCEHCSYSTYRHDIMRTHMDAIHGQYYPKPSAPHKKSPKPTKPVVGPKRGRGRPRKIIKQEPEFEEGDYAAPKTTTPMLTPSSPRRVMPERRNRGKKMMEVLSPKKKSSAQEDDSESENDESEGEEQEASEGVEDGEILGDENLEKGQGDIEPSSEDPQAVEHGEVVLEEGAVLTHIIQPQETEGSDGQVEAVSIIQVTEKGPDGVVTISVSSKETVDSETVTTSSEMVTLEGTVVKDGESAVSGDSENVADPSDDATKIKEAEDEAVSIVSETITETSTEAPVHTEQPVKRKVGRPRKTDKPRKEDFDVFITAENQTIYGCKECGKKFNSLKNIHQHSMLHTRKFSCDRCGKTFALKDMLEKHTCESDKPQVVMTVNGETVRFSCTECGKSFINEDYARQHHRIHTDLLQCKVCKRRFNSKLGMNNHRCSVTAGKKTFSCDICSQSFRTSSYLFRHMAMHTDIFKCNVCGKCFSRKDSLQRHVVKCDPERAVAEDLHPCLNCHKAYASSMALDNHMLVCYKTHCFKCSKNFETEEECSNHECNPESEPTPRAVESVIDPGHRVSCKICHKMFRNLKYLKRHEMSHSDNFNCKICKKGFSRREELMWHIVLCENAEKIKTDGSVTCELCDDGEEFTDAKSYRTHHFTHTHPYQCDKCKKRFRKEGSIHSHHCNPNLNQEKSVPCPQCDKIFSCVAYMERHAVIHGDPKFECEICNKRFYREDYIKDHRCLLPDGTPARVIRRHNRVEIKENVVCELCGATFVSSSNLNKHMKTHGEKQYECDICNKKFHYLAYMKDHKFHVHGGGLDLQCTMCGKILKTKTSLKMHMTQFHSGVGPQHECFVCHKRFRQKGNLKTHMYSHSTSKQFHCEQCGKKFKYPDQLNKHRLEHTMKNKIKCDFCTKQFVKAFDYRKHVSIFHSGMAYLCSICNAKCTHRHTLIRHFKRKHRGALHLLSEDSYIKSLLKPVGEHRHHEKPTTTTLIMAEEESNDLPEEGELTVSHQVPVSEEVVESISVNIDDTDAVAEAIANAALATEVTNTPTMSIGQTFTNELGETFTESVITDAHGNETTIVYRTPEGFSAETDLPQVAAEALQSLSHSIVSGEEDAAGMTTLNLEELQNGNLGEGDDQHTVVIVQIVNQDEEGEVSETYTIPAEMPLSEEATVEESLSVEVAECQVIEDVQNA